MRTFDEDEQEPVAVVRTLSDFALALTLVVLMLIGTRSAAGLKPAAPAHGAQAGAGPSSPDLNLVLAPHSEFALSSRPGEKAIPAVAVASQWTAAHPGQPAIVVLQFPSQVLATDLHRALLDLQTAFGTNLNRIDTVPKL